MNNQWFQWYIDKPWPIERIDNINYEGRWHYLFEPGLLVRFENNRPIQFQESIPADASWGDTSKVYTGASGGGTSWPGDVDFYLTEELHEAVLDFLHANSKMVKILRSDGRNTYKWHRKAVHLLCNQFGKNYFQEAIFYFRSAFRSLYLFMKYGSQ